MVRAMWGFFSSRYFDTSYLSSGAWCVCETDKAVI
jgi:hypothetical protein